MLALKNAGAVLALLVTFAGAAAAQTVTTTKIVNNGSDGEKLVFAVIGEGYAAADQAKYREDVENLIIEGLLGHDFYRDSRTAFNVYRVDLTSKDSGVSKPGAAKDTALKMVYTGIQKQCWLAGTTNTNQLIDQALIGINQYPHYVLVIMNEDGYGGCHPGGNRLYVTRGSGWEAVAHEYGHAMAGLYDEYWEEGAPAHNSSEVVNELNCSTKLDKTQVVWKQFIDAALNIPPMTELGPGMNPNTATGMFPGCRYKSAGIYRPAFTCRMREVNAEFCPVCFALMRQVVAPFLASPAPPTPSSSASFLTVAMRVTEGGGSQVLKVDEVAGTEIEDRESSSDFVFEVRRGGQTLNVGALSEDPFIVRAFADPNNNQGEMIERTKSATLIVKVPNVDLTEAANDNIDLRFYRVRAEAPESVIASQIDAAMLNQLKQQKLVDKRFEVSVDKLKTAARERVLRDNR